MKLTHFTIFIFLVLWSCSGEKKPELNEAPKTPVVENKVKTVKLYSTMDYLRVRSQPDLASETVYMLKNEEEMEFVEIKKDGAYTSVSLRGFPYQDPWIKIRTADDTEGWVYGGGLKFNKESEVANELIRSRLDALFGKTYGNSFQAYRRKFNKANSSLELAEVFRLGRTLRDTTEDILHEKIVVNDPMKLADMSWLNMAVPGFTNHLVAEGTMFHMFIDFKEFAKKARRTAGHEDDEFMGLGMKIFSVDSVEHFFPAWFMQTWDYGGHSELGKGIHKNLLSEMNRVLAHSQLFETEIEIYKDQLIHDITDSHVTYWLSKDAILKELDEILASDYGILTEDDKIALRTRRKLFENPDANGIKVDFRSGAHN